MGVTIPAGEHKLRSHLTLSIPKPLHYSRGSITLITGPNGSGKSTFFEKLLIPEISKDPNNVILLMNQDFEIQFYALAARSVDRKAKKRGAQHTGEALSYLKKSYLQELQSYQQLIILLDEPTRYLNPTEWVDEFSECDPITIMITHDEGEIDAQSEIQKFTPIQTGITEVSHG